MSAPIDVHERSLHAGTVPATRAALARAAHDAHMTSESLFAAASRLRSAARRATRLGRTCAQISRIERSLSAFPRPFVQLCRQRSSSGARGRRAGVRLEELGARRSARCSSADRPRTPRASHPARRVAGDSRRGAAAHHGNAVGPGRRRGLRELHEVPTKHAPRRSCREDARNSGNPHETYACPVSGGATTSRPCRWSLPKSYPVEIRPTILRRRASPCPMPPQRAGALSSTTSITVAGRRAVSSTFDPLPRAQFAHLVAGIPAPKRLPPPTAPSGPLDPGDLLRLRPEVPEVLADNPAHLRTHLLGRAVEVDDRTPLIRSSKPAGLRTARARDDRVASARRPERHVRRRGAPHAAAGGEGEAASRICKGTRGTAGGCTPDNSRGLARIGANHRRFWCSTGTPTFEHRQTVLGGFRAEARPDPAAHA